MQVLVLPLTAGDDAAGPKRSKKKGVIAANASAPSEDISTPAPESKVAGVVPELTKLLKPATLLFSSNKTAIPVLTSTADSPAILATGAVAKLDLTSPLLRYQLQVPSAGKYAVFTEHRAADEYKLQLEATSSTGDSVLLPMVDQHVFKPDHEHDAAVTSVGLTCSDAFDVKKLNEWIGNLLRTKGTDIYRMKGIVNVAGWKERFVFNGVHMLFNGVADRLWRKDEVKHTSMIFIGRNLNRAELNESFFTCVAR